MSARGQKLDGLVRLLKIIYAACHSQAWICCCGCSVFSPLCLHVLIFYPSCAIFFHNELLSGVLHPIKATWLLWSCLLSYRYAITSLFLEALSTCGPSAQVTYVYSWWQVQTQINFSLSLCFIRKHLLIWRCKIVGNRFFLFQCSVNNFLRSLLKWIVQFGTKG